MEPKKSQKASLEKHRSSFFALGLITSISLSIIAFEWNVTPDVSSFMIIGPGRLEFPDDIPPTIQPEIKTIPKMNPPDIIKIVNDDSKNIKDLPLYKDEIKEGDTIDWRSLVKTVVEQPEPETEPVVIVSDMPQFRGGDINSFSSWVQKSIKYPAIAAEIGIEEKIYITFVVEKDGTVSGVEILRGNDPSLREEVKRVMATAPKWKPGSHMGQPARVRFSMVVNFRLQN